VCCTQSLRTLLEEFIIDKIGIIAYGSLIEEPGDEIKAATVSRIDNVETPFRVEFARSSDTRDGAPTLVPVTEGGATVKAVVFVLKDSISEQEAEDMLWRRETRRVGSEEKYNQVTAPGENTVLVERVSGFSGLDIALYTKIAPNIASLAQALARLAIRSALAKAGKKGLDGISYLISIKRSGIATPLLVEYERAILQQTGANTLEEALTKVRMKARI